jgi:hypothetical protein
VGDALAFRAARRAQFPAAAENERRDEIREGLAQYTGTVVAAPSPQEAVASAIQQTLSAEKQDTFLRTFAYTSGAAYGVLLDAYAPEWRRQVGSSSDLADMLSMASAVRPALDANAAPARYRGAELRAAEEERDQQLKARVAALRQRFVDGPVLVLPGGGSGTFDARGATSIPGNGTVFVSIKFSGPWGTLEATNGVLVSSDGGTRRVPAPFRTEGNILTGDGWTVTLAPGWLARPGPRSGDYQVGREAPQE